MIAFIKVKEVAKTAGEKYWQGLLGMVIGGALAASMTLANWAWNGAKQPWADHSLLVEVLAEVKAMRQSNVAIRTEVAQLRADFDHYIRQSETLRAEWKQWREDIERRLTRLEAFIDRKRTIEFRKGHFTIV